MNKEQIILNELKKQVAIRVSEKVDNYLESNAYVKGEEVVQFAENIIKFMSDELDKNEILDGVLKRLRYYFDDYENIILQNGNSYIVRKDRISIDIFSTSEEIEENDDAWNVIKKYLGEK